MNAVLVSGDFVRTGGMDRANLALASFLAKNNPNDEIHIVAHRANAELLAHGNVHFHCVAKPAGSYLLGAAGLNRVGQKIARQVKNARVIVNGGNCDWADVNWVHYVHAAWVRDDLDSLQIVQRVKIRWRHNRSLADELAIIPRAKIVIANSQKTKRDLIERVGVAEDRIHVVYYGIDPAEFHPATDEDRRAMREKFAIAPDRPVVAFIGAPSDRRKGFDVLERAWKLANLDANLIVIGAGSPHRDGNIHYLGFREDVSQILRGCDAIVSPTRYEAYGLAIHESVCCGLAPIVSKNAGVTEQFPPPLTPLLLHDPVDASELSHCLRRWRDEIGRWRAEVEMVSRNLRARTWENMASEIISILAD